VKVIDCHAHFEPKLLDVRSIIKRMNLHGIDQTLLMSAMTHPPIYKKSNVLMGIHRTILNSKILWPLAKKLDDGFHNSPGKWDPWYRKLIGKRSQYEIILNPDNESVFEAVEMYPNKLKGWVFLNPTLSGWKEEFYRWSDHIGAIGIKIHPFWHRYSLKDAHKVADLACDYDFPLMIHLGFDSLEAILDFSNMFKKLKIIFSHAAFPFYSKLWPMIKSSSNAYIDLSSHHVDKMIINRAVSYLGPGKCLFGTDDPYGDGKAGLTIQQWINSLNIDYESKELILSKNIINITKNNF